MRAPLISKQPERLSDALAASVSFCLNTGTVEVASGSVVVGDAKGGFYARAAEEVGAEGAGLDDGDVDAEWSEFGGESFGEAFDGEFGGVVEAPASTSAETCDGGEIEDVAAALFAELWQEVREIGIIILR